MMPLYTMILPPGIANALSSSLCRTFTSHGQPAHRDGTVAVCGISRCVTLRTRETSASVLVEHAFGLGVLHEPGCRPLPRPSGSPPRRRACAARDRRRRHLDSSSALSGKRRLWPRAAGRAVCVSCAPPGITSNPRSHGVHAALAGSVPGSRTRKALLGRISEYLDSFPHTEARHLSPAVRMFLAALMSRSCSAPHAEHSHRLTTSCLRPAAH